MLGGIIDKLKQANLAALVAKGSLCCPECGAKARSAPDAGRDVARCESCGKETLIDEWILAGKDAKFLGNADKPPPQTKIVRETEAGAVVWRIPSAGKGGGLLGFGIFWCLFTFAHGAVMIPAMFGSNMMGGIPRWVIIPFYLIFWAVGIGMVYAGLRNKFARHVLRSDGETISLAREMLGRRKETVVRCSEVRSIAQKEFYQQNYQPVYGIEIRTAVKKLRFGTMLSIEEKAWLVADLRRVSRKEQGVPVKMAEPKPGIPGNRLPSFSFPLPTAWGSAIGFGMTFFLMGAGFLAVGIYLIDPGTFESGPKEPVFIRVFDAVFGGLMWLFRIVWTVIALAITSGGLWLLATAFRSKREDIRLEGNEIEVAIRTMKHGLVHKERSFPREKVTYVRATFFMSGGGAVAKRVELIVDGKAERIAACVDAEVADAFVNDVRSAL